MGVRIKAWLYVVGIPDYACLRGYPIKLWGTSSNVIPRVLPKYRSSAAVFQHTAFWITNCTSIIESVYYGFHNFIQEEYNTTCTSYKRVDGGRRQSKGAFSGATGSCLSLLSYQTHSVYRMICCIQLVVSHWSFSINILQEAFC